MVTIRDGLNRKDLRYVPPEWYRNQIRKCFNANEVQALMERIKEQSPKDAIQILISTLPKEHKVDQNSTIQLIINGLQQSKALDGTIRPALPAAEIIESEDPDNIE